MHQELTRQIREAFEAVVRSPYPESRALVEYGDIYLQLIRENAASQRWIFEAVTCDFLPPAHRLSAGCMEELRRLGFTKSGRKRNWVREVQPHAQQVEPLVEQAVDILERIYGVDGECNVQLIHTAQEHPENPGLLRAIRHLSRSRSDDDRRRLYAELVNATLLMPIQFDEETQTELPDPFVVDTFEGHPVYAVFSDWPALRQWNPRGWPYEAIHGSDFFERMAQLQCGGIRVNPDGDLGGELYFSEVRIIIEGVRAYRARQQFN
jgi:hypothetical protein